MMNSYQIIVYNDTDSSSYPSRITIDNFVAANKETARVYGESLGQLMMVGCHICVHVIWNYMI